MGRKSKALENNLVELIIDKWEGGKNTIVYVTEDVNKILQEKGLKITFSRESIRRVIRSHEDEIAATKKAVEEARVIAEILKDNPGTEIAEAALLYVQSLLSKELKSIDALEFSDPTELCSTLSQVANTQLKLSTARTKAVKALDKAKEELKSELKKEIQSDPELLERLFSIVDKVEL
jgi:arsenate reductase-like glutaredoxin family protein